MEVRGRFSACFVVLHNVVCHCEPEEIVASLLSAAPGHTYPAPRVDESQWPHSGQSRYERETHKQYYYQTSAVPLCHRSRVTAPPRPLGHAKLENL
eukprot:433012-Rhodomonas_salina.3